ncbi:MAG: hypothetical protein ABI865_02410 [Nitrosospira sp.]
MKDGTFATHQTNQGPLMDKEPLIKLTWHGHETVESIPALLNQAKQIEITLPSNYNHALFRKLHLQARTAEPEVIDALGGPELLAEIATITGLGELATLTETLTAAHATLQVFSPPKVVITLPAANLQT